MTMSVAQMAYENGYQAVETMVQVLDGKTVDQFVTLVLTKLPRTTPGTPETLKNPLP